MYFPLSKQRVADKEKKKIVDRIAAKPKSADDYVGRPNTEGRNCRIHVLTRQRECD